MVEEAAAEERGGERAGGEAPVSPPGHVEGCRAVRQETRSCLIPGDDKGVREMLEEDVQYVDEGEEIEEIEETEGGGAGEENLPPAPLLLCRLLGLEVWGG